MKNRFILSKSEEINTVEIIKITTAITKEGILPTVPEITAEPFERSSDQLIMDISKLRSEKPF